MFRIIASALIGGLLTACGSISDSNARTGMAALEARLTALEDVQNIERLFRAYGYYFDKGLWRETSTLFTDDAIVEIAQRGVYRGRAGVQRLYVNVFGRGRNCLLPVDEPEALSQVFANDEAKQRQWAAFVRSCCRTPAARKAVRWARH